MISVKLLFNIKALHFFAFISAGNEPSAVLARAFGECREDQIPCCFAVGYLAAKGHVDFIPAKMSPSNPRFQELPPNRSDHPHAPVLYSSTNWGHKI